MEESTNRLTRHSRTRGPIKNVVNFPLQCVTVAQIKLLFIVCWKVYGSLCSGKYHNLHDALEGCRLKTILRSKLGLFESSLTDTE